MSACLLGLGIAAPQHQMTQEEALQMFQDIVCEEERQKRLAGVLFRKAEVATRNTAVPHKVAYNWCDTSPSLSGRSTETAIDHCVPSPITPQVAPGQSHGPTTRERMELYARFASDLAVTAAQRALQNAQLPAEQITHLVVVTCTGFDAPGVDLELIQQLGLPNTTQRVQVGFMGCHGAINGLRTALAIAVADPSARVLLCAVELCSLHYRFTWDAEKIIGNALFADGAGALVLRGVDPSSNSAVDDSSAVCEWQIHNTGSVVISDSRQTMSWSIGNYGFDMRLTSDVGDKIESELAGWLTAWLKKQQLTLDEIDYWGVHPGGPRILSAVQSSLGLSPSALAVSRRILERHGNMSSPTVLFILNEFLQMRSSQPNAGIQHCVLLGFGPGLVAEIALLSVA